MVALAPLTVGSDAIWKAKGGNWQIWDRAAQTSANHFFRNTRVSAIGRDAQNR
jgi:hypothetical protein